LVQAVEQQAKGNARWLRKKTITLALLGYVVVLGSIVLMIPVGLGLGAAVVVLTGGNAAAAKLAFVLAIVPIGFAWHMGKSLLSGPFEYSGLEVTAQDCPALFALLQKICTKAQGPMFKRVFIDNQLNASVTRSGGLLGFFGMGPVVLTLGLPLMQSQTQQQLAGVIGHEYGHVAAKDNAWGQWVYRIRNSWLTLDDRLRFEHLWYVLKLNRFYEWFMATFSVHSFALSR
jgi:Zn-dependent protease with chaperone function